MNQIGVGEAPSTQTELNESRVGLAFAIGCIPVLHVAKSIMELGEFLTKWNKSPETSSTTSKKDCLGTASPSGALLEPINPVGILPNPSKNPHRLGRYGRVLSRPSQSDKSSLNLGRIPRD